MTWVWRLMDWYPMYFCQVRHGHVTWNCTSQWSEEPFKQLTHQRPNQKQEGGSSFRSHSSLKVHVHILGPLHLLGETAAEGAHTLLEAEGQTVKFKVQKCQWRNGLKLTPCKPRSLSLLIFDPKLEKRTQDSEWKSGDVGWRGWRLWHLPTPGF